MSGQGSYFVDVIGFGQSVDIMPMVREALTQCVLRHDFSELEVAELVEMAVRGKRIPAATTDRIEGQMLWVLTRYVISRVQSEYRVGQIRDAVSNGSRTHVTLQSLGPDPLCDGALKLFGRWLRVDELLPFPLDGCECERCGCDYRTYTRRDAARAHPDWPDLTA
ncbi:hypothetical protein C8J27_110109 [Rhodobacter aestuarii]|uniref:Uncharacterized protein n=1 Tax=Rhodobacter aestuarii TaxID=453582 RepID=A0A1N7Q3D3_9RHOB|nr:hypothetical protein [Rhodobacter aestuarii]PTV94058.1 hypothetical protein C8J27_110109 [Rhodobacter aestuarii]SIT17107.1 hypothetical protein SAMN05421580_112109 [Rhodobacter aestuarii]